MIWRRTARILLNSRRNWWSSSLALRFAFKLHANSFFTFLPKDSFVQNLWRLIQHMKSKSVMSKPSTTAAAAPTYVADLGPYGSHLAAACMLSVIHGILDPAKDRKKKAFPVLAMPDTKPIAFEDDEDKKVASSTLDELDELLKSEKTKSASRTFVSSCFSDTLAHCTNQGFAKRA